MKEQNLSYNDEDLKIKPSDIRKHNEEKQQESQLVFKEEEKEMSFFESIKVLLIVLGGYAIYSILPSLFLVKVMDYGFLTSQVYTFILAIILVFVFGLHKEANPEQLAKRDARKKH